MIILAISSDSNCRQRKSQRVSGDTTVDTLAGAMPLKLQIRGHMVTSATTIWQGITQVLSLTRALKKQRRLYFVWQNGKASNAGGVVVVKWPGRVSLNGSRLLSDRSVVKRPRTALETIIRKCAPDTRAVSHARLWLHFLRRIA